MDTIRINTKINADGHLKIDIPTLMIEGDVEVILIIESKKKMTHKYTFSDISGKLKWNGNPMDTQRLLRDEWK